MTDVKKRWADKLAAGKPGFATWTLRRSASETTDYATQTVTPSYADAAIVAQETERRAVTEAARSIFGQQYQNGVVLTLLTPRVNYVKTGDQLTDGVDTFDVFDVMDQFYLSTVTAVRA